MRRRIPLLTLLLAGAAAVTAAGCRDAATPATVTGPSADAAASFTNRGAYRDDDAVGDAHLLACAPHGTASVSLWVGASGASIHVGNDRLIIPGGALSDSILITARIPADTLADIHFEPHGLHFNKDVILVLSTDGCTVGARAPAHVDYLDNSGNVLEKLEAAFNGGSHTVTTKIHHFSSYAIAF